jgi:hypothetical protein
LGIIHTFNCQCIMRARISFISIYIYSETSIHRFRWGSEKETMDPGKQ